jgi:hypothetical protein
MPVFLSGSQRMPFNSREVNSLSNLGTKLEFKFVILEGNKSIWEELP